MNKHSEADYDKVSAQVAEKWTIELLAMLEEIVPGTWNL